MTYAGARWWRADLHVHTPFDRRHFGENLRHVVQRADEGDSAPLTEVAERFWRASAAVDIVGVTDHNSVEGFRRLQPHLLALSEAARQRGEHAPVFLPGAELTVGAERPMHFLVLFGSECLPDSIEQLIHGVFGATDPHDERGAPVPSGRSVGDFLRDLRDYCTPDSGERRIPFIVIPAHVESSSGLGVETGLHDRTGPEFAQEMRGVLRERAITRATWHGFQTTNAYGELPDHLKELLCVWEANRRELRWEDLSGEEKRSIRDLECWPLIEASDPSTYEEIGRRFSWLKMADPDLEGIRLALLDPESRLRRMDQGEPGKDYPHIRSLVVNASDFSDGYSIDLSSNLNTLIGGRGSGKSTLVEFLRYGLARDRAEDFHEGEEETRSTLERLLRMKDSRDSGATPGILLPETRVKIEFTVSGVDYRAERDNDAITISRLEAGEYVRSDELDLRSLIRPQIVSQRQIALIARDPTAQRREIDRIASSDARVGDFERNRSEFDLRLERLQGELRSAVQDEARLTSVQTELQTVRDQLDVIESGESRDTLQLHRKTRQEGRLLAQWRGQVETVAEALDAAVAEAERAADSLASDAEASDPIAARLEQQRLLLRTAAAAAAVAASLRDDQHRLDEATEAEFGPIRTEVAEAYQRLVEVLREQGATLDQHEALTGRRSLLEEQVATLRDSAVRQESLREQVRTAAAEIEALHDERGDARRAVGELLEQRNADIKLALIGYGDRASLSAMREAWFGGASLHSSDWEELLAWVFSSDQGIPGRWRDLTTALMSDARASSGQEVSELRATRSALGEAPWRLSGHFSRSVPRMDIARLESAYRMLPEDRVDASVRDADGEFKPMEQGSLGQRSTAILSLLLSAGEDPLLVDQPEEDLDNQYVYSVVVDLLRKRKFSRQLILATHNANIPVNGDAELIVSLGVSDKLGVVNAIGSIDQEQVKVDVNAVLEGSAEAFRLRKRRYGY